MLKGIERCRVCDNYLSGIKHCKFCHFEWATDYPPCNDIEWDILDIDDDIEWSHHQILDRLHYKGITCIHADIWIDDLAYLLGCNASVRDVARALGVDERCIYNDYEHLLMIINLVEEKALRLGVDISEEWNKQET